MRRTGGTREQVIGDAGVRVGRELGRRLGRRVAVTLIVAALVATACVPPSPDPAPGDPGPVTTLSFLRARTGAGAAIVDADGREVQLRGANLNHLGDYHQAYVELPTVAPLTEDDWADLAGSGFSVVRLVTNWSAWEPTRGALDPAYVARVHSAVEAANRHGLWVVIDMHQDAWSSVVFTPADEVCPEGTTHQKGWDGAPAWATDTGGLTTCTPGSREDSPAVMAAWDAFYLDRNGVRRALADTWGRIAAEFAGESGVAGFDLLNEPGHGHGLDLTVTGLGAFYVEAIGAIRAAEDALGAPHHLVFFETTVFGAWVPPFSDDPDLVFAPHVYVEAIGPAVPGLLDFVAGTMMPLIGAIYGRPVWVGEYGSFADAATNRSWMARFARLHDGGGYDGGTWWQWEQECGDPHEVRYPADAAWVASILPGCDGERMEVACPSRSYPRALPGRTGTITAEPCGGSLSVTGTTTGPSTAELWFEPAEGASPEVAPSVSGTGADDARLTRVGGGWRVHVPVDGSYSIRLG